MVTVTSRLIHDHLTSDELGKIFRVLESDSEIQSYLRMGNIMAVERMRYNDHGPVHSRIVSGSALEILKRVSRAREPSSVINGVCDYTGAMVIVLCGAYLHDIGNAIHRLNHEYSSVVLAAPILDRVLAQIYDDEELVFKLKSEILHTLYASDENVKCLSVEAGVVTAADGTDMAKGRSRKPYRGGENSIHSLSALAIDKVEIEDGSEKPVAIKVYMTNPGGIFQIDEVLERKLATSGIRDLIEVKAIMNGKEIKSA
jgi:metal-dependent HD superfamily phosphatase/phosphodiesterase